MYASVLAEEGSTISLQFKHFIGPGDVMEVYVINKNMAVATSIDNYTSTGTWQKVTTNTTLGSGDTVWN